MLTNFWSLLLAGFSIFSCLILLVAYLGFLPDMRKSAVSKWACLILLSGLMILQYAHGLFFSQGLPLIEHRPYGVLLTLIPPSFYFFSRSILFVNDQPKLSWRDSIHLIPVVVAVFFSISYLPAFAFVFGTAYTFWFAKVVYQMRNHSRRFHYELFFFGLFAVMALGALILGLLLPTIDPSVFYTAYANAISIAILLIVAALIFFPELLSDILLVSELAYSKSRLNDVDIDTKLIELEKLVVLDKHYQHEDLSLTGLAELMSLSSHQLSELINTHIGYGFPKYLREQRIKQAQRLLVTEPNSSILSISMETGFKSQSNFYTAFKEITGVSPGRYRKKTPNL